MTYNVSSSVDSRALIVANSIFREVIKLSVSVFVSLAAGTDEDYNNDNKVDRNKRLPAGESEA